MRWRVVLVAMGGLGVWNAAIGQATPSVVINEIMWAKAEYIELVNFGSDSIDLNGWYITRQKPGDAEEHIVDFVGGENINSGKYFLIESSEDATSIPADKVKSSLGLVDTGVLLRLYDSAGVVVDTANQQGAWFSGKNDSVGASMEKNSPSDDGTNAPSWHISTGNSGGRVGTPGAENSAQATPTLEPSVSPVPSPSVTPLVTLTPTVSPIISYTKSVHINEFLPDAIGDDAAGEFIELFNSSAEPQDVSGWFLDDIENAGSSPFLIPDGAIIPPQGFLVFYRSQTKISLNNDTDHVRFIRPDGIILDDIPYSNTRVGYSYNYSGNTNFVESTTLTPGEKNIITSPPTPTPKSEDNDEESTDTTSSVAYDFSSKIFINEFLPNPKGSDTEQEFIEIKNADSRSINLFGWKLDDEDGGSSPYRFTDQERVGAGKILVLYRSKTKIALNNDSDTVRLIDPAGKIISSVPYEQKVLEGYSYARLNDGAYAWTSNTTPGDENTISVQETDTPTPKVAKVKTKKVATSSSKGNNVVSNSPIPRVLGAGSSSLPWPGLPNSGEKIQTIIRNPLSFYLPYVRQRLFVVFGMTMAFAQMFSGISRKERIWQKR